MRKKKSENDHRHVVRPVQDYRLIIKPAKLGKLNLLKQICFIKIKENAGRQETECAVQEEKTDCILMRKVKNGDGGGRSDDLDRQTSCQRKGESYFLF